MLVSGPLIKPVQTRIKTETRRLTGLDHVNKEPHEYDLLGIGVSALDATLCATFENLGDGEECEIFCPYGKPGDTLWVRENWYVVKGFDDVKPRNLPRNDIMMKGYMADGAKPGWAGKTRPSIHIPRWLSRINLHIDELGVQRLYDIDEQSARREGVLMSAPLSARSQTPYKDAFERTWIKLNGQQSWNLNPWVWVIKFTLKTP